MRELIISFILVTTFSVTLNKPAQPQVKAESVKTTQEAPKKAVKKKAVKHATKSTKAPQQAPKQPVAVPRVVKPSNNDSNGTCRDWIRRAGISDVESAYQLIMRESGCQVTADNPTSDAYGIPQSLPGSKMASHGSDWATNPVTQLKWMQDYVNARYGGFAQANAFQLVNSWY